MAVRIAALYLSSVLLLLALLGGFLYFGVEATLLDVRRQDLQATAGDAAGFLQLAVSRESDLVTLAPALAASLPRPAEGARSLRIFSSNGTLLVALPPDRAETANRPSAAVARLLPPSLLALTLTPVERPGVIYAAQAIHGVTPGGQPGTIGVVEAAQSRADIDGILDRLRGAFAGGAALAAALAVAAGWLLARSVARPVRRLEATAAAIAGGDLSRRVDGLPRNEIGALGESFNHMAARLADLLAEARSEQARLAALLAGLADGALACDRGGALTLANPAARTMLGLAHDSPSVAVGEAAAALGVAALWRRAMGQEAGQPAGPVEREIQAGGRALLAVAGPIYEPDALDAVTGAVCILRDISHLRELEQGRAAVLRRLGHELRTPLAALRAVLANLSDRAAPADAPALHAAEDEAARLSRLVEEILAVGRGGPAGAIDARPTDLRALATATCALFAARAARLGLRLEAPASGPPVVVRGDPDRLRQALVNLLDNAVRHTPPGGRVAVRVDADATEAALQVQDTGEGMDPLTSRWAFEPYYQGAAGRAGDGAPASAGGSGLGLAIVREIVAAHEGTVGLESSPGAGATITIRLPLLRGTAGA
jgi:two-component system, OmpR family, sensor histidine kinase ResE